MKIQGRKSRDVYIYDEVNLTVTDKIGNCIKLFEPLEGISENNLRLYLDELFHNFYRVSNSFKNSCLWDKAQIEKIEWKEFK